MTRAEYKAKWQRDNLEKRRLSYERYWTKNRVKKLKYLQEYHKKNRVKEQEQRKSRWTRDFDYRLKIAQGTRIRLALRRTNHRKTCRTIQLLGCGIPELRVHLEKQFRPGMSWENYGPIWHIDHIRPCASFDLSDPKQQKLCFHFSNLQPLFAVENRRKSDSYPIKYAHPH